MSGVHFRSHNILLQLKLVEAIKEAGNIKRFLPSEFGMDPARMGDALEPGRVTFDEKMIMTVLTPPKERFVYMEMAMSKVPVFVDEYDIATYTIKTIDDPRTLNKTVYIRPPENILSQRQIVETWEKLTGKKLDKFSISKEDFLASMEGKDFTFQVGVGHFYHIYYEGCLTNFEIGEEGEETATLYPEVNYNEWMNT
ncbi:Isoflavone reductase-like [Vitis vinifera]|uniref:Isoflavone reductase-like n=1 Tax=Vitis vinifera TaxID=29760 RepID=A0A438CZG8_VITVI|nr:Isoflavone reductase-like [Vitis vinifera]